MRIAGVNRVILAALCGTAALAGFSCGASSSNSNLAVASAHVFLLVEENHSYAQVIGNPSMPYLNSLVSRYGLGTQYYADTHPSIGNYFMLTAGQIETNDDGFSGTVSDDNIVRGLVKAGKTWRSYAENLPSPGYTGGDVYPYLKRHNPFAYFSDVVGTSQQANLVSFSRFSSDLAGGTLPDFSFIVPDAMNDAHDGTLAAADSWLQANIDPLIQSSTFQKNGLLILVFDESVTSDTAHGGGQVPLVVVGPRVKSAYRSSTFYQHESVLRLILSTLGLRTFPGKSAPAPPMAEFFH